MLSGAFTMHQCGTWYPCLSNSVHPVGKKEPNEWGLYDISGNVILDEV